MAESETERIDVLDSPKHADGSIVLSPEQARAICEDFKELVDQRHELAVNNRLLRSENVGLRRELAALRGTLCKATV